MLSNLCRRALLCIGMLTLTTCATATNDKPVEATITPVEQFGSLSVEDAKIVGQDGTPAVLKGISWFWSTTGWKQERFYNKDAVQHVTKDWNASLVRAAMGVEVEGGYLTDPDGNRERVKTLVDAAIEQGIYVLIDWHSHHAEDHTEAAVEFFTDMATRYGHAPNVIYEIYNEPLNDTDWSTVIKPYAETVIGAIRTIDPDNLIVVGTRSWSQDVDEAAKDPITGFENIAYTLHFYAGSHGEELREKAREAMSLGAALFVTEWGTVDANGDGDVATKSTKAWLDFMDEHGLSHANWSLSDKVEGASLLKNGVSETGPWTAADLTTSGVFVLEILASDGE